MKNDSEISSAQNMIYFYQNKRKLFTNSKRKQMIYIYNDKACFQSLNNVS